MSSAQYYDENAESFFSDTVGADMTDARNRFLAHLPRGGKILDAGCGSGRDMAAFAAAGYEVTGFDASTEMVKRAAEYSGRPVLHMTFDDVEWTAGFDGVWACASLLHISTADLATIMVRLANALRANGVLYGSFKYGTGEVVRGGRRFTNLDEPALGILLSQVPGLSLVEVWLTDDVRPQRTERWLNFIARRR